MKSTATALHDSIERIANVYYERRIATYAAPHWR